MVDKGGKWNCIFKVLRKNINLEFYTQNYHSVLRVKQTHFKKIKRTTIKSMRNSREKQGELFIQCNLGGKKGEKMQHQSLWVRCRRITFIYKLGLENLNDSLKIRHLSCGNQTSPSAI